MWRPECCHVHTTSTHQGELGTPGCVLALGGRHAACWHILTPCSVPLPFTTVDLPQWSTMDCPSAAAAAAGARMAGLRVGACDRQCSCPWGRQQLLWCEARTAGCHASTRPFESALLWWAGSIARSSMPGAGRLAGCRCCCLSRGYASTNRGCVVVPSVRGQLCPEGCA